MNIEDPLETMMASEVVSRLQELIRLNGDRPVTTSSGIVRVIRMECMNAHGDDRKQFVIHEYYKSMGVYHTLGKKHR